MASRNVGHVIAKNMSLSCTGVEQDLAPTGMEKIHLGAKSNKAVVLSFRDPCQ